MNDNGVSFLDCLVYELMLKTDEEEDDDSDSI